MKSLKAVAGCLLGLVCFTAVPSVWSQADVSGPEGSFSSVEERRLLLNLQEERLKLREKEKELQQREMELKTLKVEVEKKLDDLERLRAQIEGLLKQKSDVEAQQVKELSQIYEKMDPTKAAKVIAELDEGLAIQVLSSMKRKSAGKILNNVEKGKATSLSEGFSELK